MPRAFTARTPLRMGWGKAATLACRWASRRASPPPREHGPQNLHESFHQLWQQKVWERFPHARVLACQATSDRFVAACRQRRAAGDDQAPPRRAFPKRWQLDLQPQPSGTVICLRRTHPEGTIQVVGHRWAGARLWGPRLVRAAVDLTAQQIRCYRLRGTRRKTSHRAKLSNGGFLTSPFSPPDQHQGALAP